MAAQSDSLPVFQHIKLQSAYWIGEGGTPAASAVMANERLGTYQAEKVSKR